jgi:hypothetical protein
MGPARRGPYVVPVQEVGKVGWKGVEMGKGCPWGGECPR